MGRIQNEVLSSPQQIKSYAFTDVDEVMICKHGNKWSDYRRKWSESSNLNATVNEYPLYVLTELNSFCNLRCLMCKHSEDNLNMERKSMPIEMFHKVIEQCNEMSIPSINIGTGTECTLHPDIEKIMQIMSQSNAIDKFFLTNGTTLNQKMINNIFETGFERVEISVDASSSETYEKIRRNGKYQKLENSINMLINEKQKRKTRLPIIRLSFCVQSGNVNEIDEFYEKWKDRVDIIEFQKMVTLGRQSVGNKNEQYISKMTCVHPCNRLTVDYDGNIYPCCSILYQSEYCLGNINDMMLYEAWHGKKIMKLRESFKTGKLFKHCNNCLLSIYGE